MIFPSDNVLAILFLFCIGCYVFPSFFSFFSFIFFFSFPSFLFLFSFFFSTKQFFEKLALLKEGELNGEEGQKKEKKQAEKDEEPENENDEEKKFLNKIR